MATVSYGIGIVGAVRMWVAADPKDRNLCRNCPTLPYRYRLKARYPKSGEKSRHFSYPDYFIYPVCHDQPCGQRGPDNRGCTVLRRYILGNMVSSHNWSDMVAESVSFQYGKVSFHPIPCG